MRGPDVILRAEGGVGHISLNRPHALHALTFAMCTDITEALLAWENDPSITSVTIDHSEGRGFCAGGDIRQLYDALQAGDNIALEFFRTEYRLNQLLFTYKKPTTCFMDGVVMGGGAGIAMPCRTRIATLATQFAMPETGIGLFPDVGGGWFLSRLPGRIGEWLALTGRRLGAVDCLALGLATEFAPRAQAMMERSELPREDINRLFEGERMEDVMATLHADGSEFARLQLAEIMKRSPTSCKVALRQLRESRKLEQFVDVMKMEFRIVTRMLARPDIREGIRAFIIDKDAAPRWSPLRFDDVSDAEIDAIFAPLPHAEEWTPLQRN